MLKKSEVNKNRSSLLKHIIIGAVMGGVLGAFSSVRDLFLAGRPYNTAAVGIGLGIFLGGLIGNLLQLLMSQETSIKYQPEARDSENFPQKIQLREERLDISKKRVRTGDVAMHKELLTEEKTFTVPVTREDLVIEKMSDKHQETVRIPICEEQVKITKHPVILEDVKINSHSYQTTERIETTLKKEKPRLETTGDAKIIEKETAD